MRKYYIKTYGCQMNASDSERIAAFLERQGYKKAPNIKGADLIVINACSVRQSAIDRIFGLKPKFKKLKAKKILTGCVLKSDKKKFKEFFDEVLSIEELLGKDYLYLKPKYLYSDSAFVPIMTGCDNFCAYCVVPYTRGQEISRKPEEIINEVKNLINPAKRGKQKYKEITLLGQNVNSYKGEIKDKKQKIKNTKKKLKTIGFPELLQITNKIPGKFKIKFLTNHPKDFSNELINTIVKCKKIAKEIHLPVQSGDDEILKKMNRGYTNKQYKNLVKKIRKKIPNVKISTDVIVGFPGETKKQFENTVKLFKEINFDKAYIAKYSPRAGTAAYKLKDNIPFKEKKRRWSVLNDIANKENKPKIIVILGPTASGKSNLAIKIAKEFNGEVISADSRQIYKDMDVGTGKINKKQMQAIPHHCMDFAGPKKQITVAEYRKKALKAIDKIYKKNKIPILCGGTGLYIQAVVEGLTIPEVKPDLKLRKELENKTTEELFKELKKLDLCRAKEIDSKNRRRLIRALEIVLKTGKPVPKLKTKPQFDVLYIGIKKTLPELKKSINQRIDKMVKNGLNKEVKKLTKKYGWTAVLKNAIGYQEWLEESTIKNIKLHTFQFAKRQLSWFKKYPGQQIHWIYPHTKTGFNKVLKLCKEFLQNK